MALQSPSSHWLAGLTLDTKPALRRADIRRISGLRRSPQDGFSMTSGWNRFSSLSSLVGNCSVRCVCPQRQFPTHEERDENLFHPDVTENPFGSRISALRRAGSGPWWAQVQPWWAGSHPTEQGGFHSGEPSLSNSPPPRLGSLSFYKAFLHDQYHRDLIGVG